MPGIPLWAGALSLLLQHQETGCVHAGRQAADLLERLAADNDVDAATRDLLERAANRLPNAAPPVAPNRSPNGSPLHSPFRHPGSPH